jgi:phenol hydroxylase P3 protein
MDMKVTKKLNLKDRYNLLTRDLDWTPTYQAVRDVYPYLEYEGIKIHDWSKFEDPFRLTMDAYWKYQAEKERKLYAIIDAFNQNNGHLQVTDARYVNALKLFLTGVSPLEYMAHRGFAHVGRQLGGAGPRVACQMQALDEIRHSQTQIHSMSNYNKFYNGMQNFRHQHDRVWYLSVPKSFFDDAVTAGPFEFMVAIGFAFEYVLTNLLFVPFISGAAYNGDMAAHGVWLLGAKSDEARHMTLGLEMIKFILEQDPDNLPIVQAWIDKWFWRGYRVLTLVAMMMDYMLPKRVMSWKEAWEIYEQNGGALFRPGALRHHRAQGLGASLQGQRPPVAPGLGTCSTTTAPLPRSTPGCPSERKWSGCRPSTPTPSTNTTARVTSTGRAEQPRASASTTRRCPCCARPARSRCSSPSRRPDQDLLPRVRLQRHEVPLLLGRLQDIFDNEPEKYVQSWLPVHQIYQGNCFP